MHNNRYYPVLASDPNINEIVNICVGSLEDQRKSVDETKIIIKLCEGDTNNYEVLAPYTELNHEECFALMQTPEWTKGIPEE